MALSHAILALLVDCPASGYDLVKSFAESIGFFWKASHQQVYRELARLEAQGWVRAEAISQVGRPDKKVYGVTELGRQALVEWIEQPCELAPIKDDLLVKTFAGHLVSPTTLRQEIEAHRQRYQERLATYEHIATQFFPVPQALLPADLFRYLTLRRGIRHATEWIHWCDETLQFLSTLSPTSPPPSEPVTDL